MIGCRKAYLVIISLCCVVQDALAQPIGNAAMYWVDSIAQIIREDQRMDSQTKSILADSAFQVALREGDLCRQVMLRSLQATHLDNTGRSDSALNVLYWANKVFKTPCDSLVLMGVFNNLMNVYLSLGELDRLDSVSRVAIPAWNPKWEDREYWFAMITNMAIAQVYRQNLDSANTLFHRTYAEAKKDGDRKYIQIALNNLGSLKGYMNDLDSAFYFLNEGAIQAQQFQETDNLLSLLVNLASLEKERGRFPRAVVLLDSAYALADTVNNLEKMGQVQRTRAELYADRQDFKNAYQFLTDFVSINARYLDDERVKAVTEMMEKYESEKKARQIQQLEIDNLDATLKNEQITNTRNRYLFGGIGVVILAIGLWSRLHYVRKSKAAIQKEKDVSEGLLLNILPASVADELKAKGYADAQHFDEATILFSDFKGFTTISSEMNAADLVKEINVCFKAFDEIITRFGLEKIKTIGDAYMAAASLPENSKSTVKDAIMAAMGMQAFIESRRMEREQINLPAFAMRVGLHTGPVVAGIVGVKKFQYDIWGDTVNIASRMETASEPGRVNISEATYKIVRNDPDLQFEPRGMVDVKGKGMMAMYFVSQKQS